MPLESQCLSDLEEIKYLQEDLIPKFEEMLRELHDRLQQLQSVHATSNPLTPKQLSDLLTSHTAQNSKGILFR